MDWAILDGLSEADRNVILGAAIRRRYRRRATIVHQGDVGDSLHLLERGRAAVQVATPDGDLVTIGVIGPGAYFGEQALVGRDGVRMAAVLALEPVETLALHRDAFERLRAGHPSVDDVLVRALSDRVNRLTEHLVDVLFVAAEIRVCRRLLELTELYVSPNQPNTASVELTQEELAMLAGTSRPTVNGVLSELTKAGIVGVRRGAVDVHDRAALIARC